MLASLLSDTIKASSQVNSIFREHVNGMTTRNEQDKDKDVDLRMRGRIDKAEEKKMDDEDVSISSSRFHHLTPRAVDPLGGQSNDEQEEEQVVRKTVVRETRRGRSAISFLGALLRTLVLDIPLLTCFAMYMATITIEQYATTYILPEMDLMVFDPDRRTKEYTYYHRQCTWEDVTTDDEDDLIVQYDDMTTQDAVDLMMYHGASIYPNVLSPETANEVRDFVIKQNERGQDMIGVIENENRWSFGMRVDQDPSIAKALKEILSNEFLVAAIEQIMGPDPAVIEFTGITSAYGAKEQHYHADVVPEGNSAKWGRNFVPSYSLFIPLQNVTSAMGATDLCPGSHMCADGCYDFCNDHGFQVSGKRDNWPAGWGALVNQQTFHRGAAHIDEDGPHRVLFIMTFAPRPQFGKGALETRMIGQGGSYSLHWTQWGHTLRDFRDSEERMKQPWRVLRSLGLYKPRGARWGWDVVTQAAARIANNELGFYPADLEAFVKDGGFSFLPDYLQSPVPLGAYESNFAAWVPFYMETITLCREFLRSLYPKALAAYLVAVLTIGALFVKANSRRRLFWGSMGRLVLIHSTIYFLGWYCMYRVSVSSWGRSIIQERLYQFPELPHTVRAPSLPSTLPTEGDVMIFSDLQSEYLASNSQVLNVFHPGNNAFFERASEFAPSYRRLSPVLRGEVCVDMRRWMQREHRRLLVKNEQNDWAVLSSVRDQDKFCHQEMMKLANPYYKKALRQVEFAVTEAKFGYWRDTSLHQKWIPSLLEDLQNQLLDLEQVESRALNIGRSKPSTFKRVPGLLKLSTISISPVTIEAAKLPLDSLNADPEFEKPIEWMEQGMVVEAAYGSLMTGNCYALRGKLSSFLTALTHRSPR